MTLPGNIPFASHAHILMYFDPFEIENVKQKISSKCSNLICCRGQVQRPFSCDSLAVRRILVLLMTSNEPNEHRQLATSDCKRSNSSTTPSFLVKRSTSFCTTVDLIRVLLSFQCTKALSDLTAKLRPNVDGAAYLVCHGMRIKGILGGRGRAKPLR